MTARMYIRVPVNVTVSMKSAAISAWACERRNGAQVVAARSGAGSISASRRISQTVDVTDHFHHLGRQAGLPPIRLHDLRHGAAALALAAGVDMKTISDTLRHSSIVVTADIYGSILPQLAQDAAEETAAIVPCKHRGTPAA